MPAVRRTRTMEMVWSLHRRLYRVSGGRLGGTMMGMPVLLLTTTGRKSGEPRTSPLMYFPEGAVCVVIASNAGEPTHPAWWLNLRAHPDGQIQIGRRMLHVRAREAEGAERERLWSRVVHTYRGYAAYQARTSRRIPVAILEPIDQP